MLALQSHVDSGISISRFRIPLPELRSNDRQNRSWDEESNAMKREIMMGYATYTGTKRNLAALAAAQWRILLTPESWRPSTVKYLRHHGFRYAIDNGAWSAYQKKEEWDQELFEKLLKKMGRDADWVALPDVVCGGISSLRRSIAWVPFVLGRTTRALIPVQDGMVDEDVQALLGPRIGIFVGGSTEWKLRSIPRWAALGIKRRCWVHVARVNTKKRINLCSSVFVDSFDGTSASRFASSLPRLEMARRQLGLIGGE